MGAWKRTIEQVIAESERRGGFLGARPIMPGDWHLATGLPLSGSGDVQATVRTGTTIHAAKWIAGADTSDYLCLTVPLTDLLHTYDPVHGAPEVLLYASAAQGGSGTTTEDLNLLATAVWEYSAAGSFTDTSIPFENADGTIQVNGADDTRHDGYFDLTGAASAADLALITSRTVLNIKITPSDAIAANQLAYIYNAWLVCRQHLVSP